MYLWIIVYLIHIYYNEIKKPHFAPVKLWWILLKDVSALIDSFASNVNYGVRQGFCLHWSNLLPYHSVNGRTGCWVFSLETWKFHTSEIQLVQCLEKKHKNIHLQHKVCIKYLKCTWAHWDFCTKFLSNWLYQFMLHIKNVA